MSQGSGSKILLIILGVFGLLGLLTIGCCVGISMFGIGALTTAVKDGYADHELVRQHIGEINNISTNFSDTGETDGGMVFDVEGSKASGQIVVYQQQGDRFGDGELRVGGQTYDLGPSHGGSP